jgi:hypothetical protein
VTAPCAPEIASAPLPPASSVAMQPVALSIPAAPVIPFSFIASTPGWNSETGPYYPISNISDGTGGIGGGGGGIIPLPPPATVTAAVPEPTSWMLMGTGFGVMGAAVRVNAAKRRSV